MIRPLHDNVLVEVLEDDERVSPGGIVYSRAYEKVGKRARVLAVGPGRLPWRSRSGVQWSSLAPKPEDDVRQWSAARQRIDMEPGDVVIYQDHRLRWHSGAGDWPETGDRAIIPADAVLMVASSVEEAKRAEVIKLGVIGGGA